MCDCGINVCVNWIILQAWSKKSIKMYSVQSMYIFQVHHLHFYIHFRYWYRFFVSVIDSLINGTDVAVYKSNNFVWKLVSIHVVEP